MKTRFLAVAIILFCFSSCIKKDEPIVLPPHGDALTQTLACGADYSTQFFYNFKEGKVVHSGKVDSWHLAFESSAVGSGVFLNGGIGMALIATHKQNFHEVIMDDYNNQIWQQDDPNGLTSKSAIGNWHASASLGSQVYLLRLDAAGQKVLALKLSSVSDTKYNFVINDLTTGELFECELMKNPTCVYSYYNLNDFQTRTDVEPNMDDWDILFTRYGFTFYDQNPPVPYIVTGVLINPRTQVFKDSTATFYDIESDIIPTREFITDRDAIGFDWKRYDFDLGIYHIRQDYNFIVHTQNDDYYKMRFLSFYDDNGVKGSPTFEYRQIQ